MLSVRKSLSILIIMFLVQFVLVIAAFAQDEEDEIIEIRPPDFVSADYGFGIALPDGYIVFDYDVDQAWVAEIVGDPGQPTGQLTAETLPDDVPDVAAFWQLLKDRDPVMENSITYEMNSSVGGTLAIQARTEQIEGGVYVLGLSWIFVHDGTGFSLSVYPGSDADVEVTRFLGQELTQQFRFMEPEEIEAFQSGGETYTPEEEEEETEIPQGVEY